MPGQGLTPPGPARRRRLNEHAHPAHWVAQLEVPVGLHRNALVRLPGRERGDQGVIEGRLEDLAENGPLWLRQALVDGQPAHVSVVGNLVGGLAEGNNQAVPHSQQQVEAQRPEKRCLRRRLKLSA